MSSCTNTCDVSDEGTTLLPHEGDLDAFLDLLVPPLTGNESFCDIFEDLKDIEGVLSDVDIDFDVDTGSPVARDCLPPTPEIQENLIVEDVGKSSQNKVSNQPFSKYSILPSITTPGNQRRVESGRKEIEGEEEEEEGGGGDGGGGEGGTEGGERRTGLIKDGRGSANEWRRKRVSDRMVTSNRSSTFSKNAEGVEGSVMACNTKSKIQTPMPRGEKIKANREPLPMKLRALPHSFWKEPNTMNSNDLPTCPPPLLPPLFSGQATPNQDTEENEGVEALPCLSSSSFPSYSPINKKKMVMTSKPSGELFDRLFDHLEKKRFDESLIVRRGRPRKKESSKIPPPPQRNHGDDPCIVEALATKLFPDLSLENQQSGQNTKKPKNFSVVRIGKGVEFPAIQVANNYPAILTELVSHL